jgi:N utilization substance protein A
MGELGEEKIDIIEWAEEIDDFIGKALSPAKVEKVKLDGDVATVMVAEDQLSLAIGRDGQNVRLASKITGKKIDIVGPDGKSSKPAEKPAEGSAEAAATSELTPALTKKLEKAGKTVEEAKAMTLEQLMELEGFGKATAQKIFDALKS